MSRSTPELDLKFGDNPVCTPINGLCNFSDWHGVRNVNVKGQPLFRYNLGDKEAEKLAVVFVFQEGWAQQKELSAVLGCHESTLRGWTRRIEKDGIIGAARKKRRSPLLKMGGTNDILVARFFDEGLSNYAIGRRLRVGEHAVRLALKRLGFKRKKKAKAPELKFPELEIDGEIISENEVREILKNEDKSKKDAVSKEAKFSQQTSKLTKQTLISEETSTKTEASDLVFSEHPVNEVISSDKELSKSVGDEDKSNGENSSTEARAAHESKILTDKNLDSVQTIENDSITRTTEVVLNSEPVASANVLVNKKESEKISAFELPELIQPGFCLDSNPDDRSFDRWMAMLELVNDALWLSSVRIFCPKMTL